MACLQTLDSKTAIKQQPATNRIIGPIFRSPKAKKKKSEEWKQTKIMEISCSTKEWKESRENCRHFLGAAAAAVKSRRLFSLPHVDNRIRISDADTKVEKKLKIEFFFHLHRRYLSFWRMQMSRPFPSPKKNLSIEPLPIISRLNCLFSNLFH